MPRKESRPPGEGSSAASAATQGPRPYTATADEAHLPAEETQAGQDPRVPGEDADAWWPGDHQPSPAQRPQAPHPLDGSEATPPVPQRRVRPRLPRRLFPCDPPPRPLQLSLIPISEPTSPY